MRTFISIHKQKKKKENRKAEKNSFELLSALTLTQTAYDVMEKAFLCLAKKMCGFSLVSEHSVLGIFSFL